MLAASTISGGFSFSIPPSPFYPVESKQLPKSAASLSLGHSTLIKTKPIPPSILSPPTFSKEHRILQPQALTPKVNLKTTTENTTTPSSVLSMPPAAIPQPLTPPAAALTLTTTTTTNNTTPSSPSFSLAVTAAEMTISNTMESVVMEKQEKIEFESSCGDFKIPEQIQKFEECLQRELLLLGKLKHHFLADPSNQLGVDQFDEEPQSAAKLGEELRAIMESKRVALSALMPSLHDTDKMKEQLARVMGKLPQTSLDKIMSITIQPAEVAVANRYLLPVPEVSIAPTFRGTENGTSLIVSVKLFYHGSGKEVATTMQGKQEILQGIKQVNVDKNGKAAFGKLKVMEVSSKHRHQSFCLVFYLEEYSPQGSKRTLTQVKSTPFHVQSRPAKRKREPNGESTGSAEEDEGEESALKKKKKEKKISLEEQQQQPQQQTDRTPVAMQDCNYIDITDLLTLPQKEAARRLGISESMLCKRFKECTRRKWPYRYLRKIDKVINMLNLHKSDDGTVPKEDQEKLQRLNKEREECLRPVRIRITSYDRMSPMMRLRSRAADYDEEDIPIDALETLEMLKSSAKGSKRSSKEGGKRKERKKNKEQSCNNVASDEAAAAAAGASVLSKIEDNEEEEASLMMMEDTTSASSDSEEMQDTSVAEGGESALESLRASLCASDDEELNSSSSSSDFEINENAKEEESLFDFGKEMGEPKTVTAGEQMVVEGEEGTTTSAPLAESTACSSN